MISYHLLQLHDIVIDAVRKKNSSELDISRSLIRIFELKPQYTFARCEKYSSELDISRSLIRIFG